MPPGTTGTLESATLADVLECLGGVHRSCTIHRTAGYRNPVWGNRFAWICFAPPDLVHGT